jgi:hypothetical protein
MLAPVGLAVLGMLLMPDSVPAALFLFGMALVALVLSLSGLSCSGAPVECGPSRLYVLAVHWAGGVLMLFCGLLDSLSRVRLRLPGVSGPSR